MKQFEVIYNYFNNALFNNNLPFQEFKLDANKKFPLRWDRQHIIIGSEFVSLNTFEFFILLIHEMVHIKCHEFGLDDLGINQYHKKDFLKLALDLGFFVIKHKSQGWSIISPIAPRNAVNCIAVKSPNSIRNYALFDILSNIDCNFQELKNELDSIYRVIRGNPPSKTFFLKYRCRCPEPHNSIRSGRRPVGNNREHPDAMCKTCRSDYLCVSELPE